MKAPLCVLLALTGLAPVAANAAAQSASQATMQPTTVAIHVREIGGIRRSAFPVTARVPLPRAALTDTAHARLLLKDAEVPVQVTATSRWPDGSLQWVDVDFNVSPGPGDFVDYVLEYGPGVSAAAVARGLSVVEEADAIQVGNVRFGRSAAPLMSSVKYRDEAIAAGVNGVMVIDAAGVEHALSSAEGLKVEVIKRGPLVVALKYSGTVALPGTARAPVSLTIEMPSSKSWVKFAATVDDSSRQVGALTLSTPLALGPLPWVWDFGTNRWTYGQLRTATDNVTLSSVRARSGVQWSVAAGLKGREQPVETNALDHSPFNGWGHIQGGKEVVAFAVEGATDRSGTTRVALSGDGQTTFRFSPSSAQTHFELTVYEHFVATPVQIGAATSPAAILSPPTALCDRVQYTRSGVPVPIGVP